MQKIEQKDSERVALFVSRSVREKLNTLAKLDRRSQKDFLELLIEGEFKKSKLRVIS